MRLYHGRNRGGVAAAVPMQRPRPAPGLHGKRSRALPAICARLVPASGHRERGDGKTRMGYEVKHQTWELIQKQSLPLTAKIAMSKKRIREWYDAFDGEVYVAFSGGKDSTVLLRMVREMYPEVPAVFCDTGLEYPEIREFVKTVENVTWIKPEMNFRKVIQEYGYPVASKETSQRIYEIRNYNISEEYRAKLLGKGRRSIPQKWRTLIDAPFQVSSKCCKIMKKKPLQKYEKETGKVAFVATMACEGSLRLNSWRVYGCNAFDKDIPQSRPMSFWLEKDVLEYLVTYNVPYCPVYGEIVQEDKQTTLFDDERGGLVTTGCNRTGCMFCMYGCHMEKAPNRFQIMKETHPKQYNYCMKPWNEGGLGLDEVLTYIHVDH